MAVDDHSFEVGATSGAHLRIRNLQDGAIVSGQADVVIVTAYEHICGEETTLWIDGQFCGHAITHPDLNDGVRKEVFFLETYKHSNAEHVLAVTDNFGGFDTRRVIFRNAVSDAEVYSYLDAVPPGGSEFPYFIKAFVTPPQQWRVELATLSGLRVRRFEGHGSRIDLRWDGRHERGQSADEAPFFVTITALDSDVGTCVGVINRAHLSTLTACLGHNFYGDARMRLGALIA